MRWQKLVVVVVVLGSASKATPQPRAAGMYGYWERDSVGMPVLQYTFDQIQNASAGRYTPSAGAPWERVYWGELPLSTDNEIRAHSEHPFQLGNDRIVVVANNFGAVRVRQDEGGPKFLQDATAAFPQGYNVDPETVHFGGGFGYLLDLDDRPLLTSYFTGDQAELAGCTQREYGIGFMKTTSTTSGFKVEHTVAVPVGDDPLVLVQVASCSPQH